MDRVTAGGLLLDVWNMRISLYRIVPAKCGYALNFLLDESHSDKTGRWLREAFGATGGNLGLSGHYPIVIPIPDWLEAEIALAVLG